MKTIDIGLGRKKLLAIKVGKKNVEVLQPTLQQLLDHEAARADMLEEATKLREKGEYTKAAKVQMDFLVREVEIFTGLEQTDILKFTDEQRLELMRAVRPELYEAEEGETSGDPPPAG